MIPKPKDSGVREDFATGSRRDTRQGKGRYDLLPTRALELLAIHFENGSEKYGDRNWEKGQPLSRYLDSALRHLFKHLQGLRDEPHDVAAAWNILCMIDTHRRVIEGILPESLNDLTTLQALQGSLLSRQLDEIMAERDKSPSPGEFIPIKEIRPSQISPVRSIPSVHCNCETCEASRRPLPQKPHKQDYVAEQTCP